MTPIIYSQQYRCFAVVPMPGEKADSVLVRCQNVGAVTAGGEFVVVLRETIGPELWTEQALRRSLPL